MSSQVNGFQLSLFFKNQSFAIAVITEDPLPAATFLTYLLSC